MNDGIGDDYLEVYLLIQHNCVRDVRFVMAPKYVLFNFDRWKYPAVIVDELDSKENFSAHYSRCLF